MEVPGAVLCLEKAAGGNPSWLSCSFSRIKDKLSFLFCPVFMYIHSGRAWGPAECVSIFIKVKAAVEESVMPAHGYGTTAHCTLG